MKTVKALKLHEDNVHFKKFKCDSCDQAFSQKSELQKHLKNKTPNKKHFCSVCSFSACMKNGLTFHYKQKHSGLTAAPATKLPEVNKQLTGSSVESITSPKNPVQSTAKVDDIQIKVEEIEAPETESSNQDESNAKENASNLTLICKTEACLKTFQDLNTIILHIYKDHKITHSKTIINCKYCKKRLLSHEKLKLHVSLVHKDKKGGKCEFCFKEYSTCGHGGLENYVTARKNDENQQGKKYITSKIIENSSPRLLPYFEMNSK